MNWSICEFLVVLGGCKDFKEAQTRLLQEGIRQLEVFHLQMALRTYDPADVDIELLRAKEIQAELEKQIAALQKIINQLGGPHGTGEAQNSSGGPARERLAPRPQPAACDRAGRPADSPGDPVIVAIRTGRAAPPWGPHTPGPFSEQFGRPRSPNNPDQ